MSKTYRHPKTSDRTASRAARAAATPKADRRDQRAANRV